MSISTQICLLLILILGAISSSFGQLAVQPGASDPLHFGNPDAQMKIEVFIDLQCPACADYNERLRAVEEKYPKKVQIIFRHFPLAMHDKAMIAARAVEAANEQGKGLQMTDLMFANQKLWSDDPKVKMFAGYARRLGLDLDRFSRNFDSEAILNRVQQDIARARSLKLNSTPTVFIDGKELTYPEALEIEKIVSEGN